MDSNVIKHEDISYNEILEKIRDHVNNRDFTEFGSEINLKKIELYKNFIPIDISIQASRNHYSIPRDNVDTYTAVEIMAWFDFSKEFDEKYKSGEIHEFVPIEELAQELYNYINDIGVNDE